MELDRMKVDKIKEHYIKEAKKFGASKQSTMKDINIRDKEVEKIIECLTILKTHFNNPKILEVGCGNGYTAEQIVEQLDSSLTCIDFCEDFIEIAKKRNLRNVTFEVGDVLDLKFDGASYDIVYSERCLINLVSWEKQKRALNEIRRVLDVGGAYLMIEAFTDGLDNLNEARKAVGLDPIPQHFQNRYFDKKEFFEYVKDKFEEYPGFAFKETSNFLSTYYFGTRVLYHALIAGRKEWVPNNKFDQFFRYLPAYGNYAPVQMFVLKKI